MEKHRYSMIELDRVDSTNVYIRNLVNSGLEEGVVVIAKTQTHGKGRNDNSWHSPVGGIYMSILLRPIIHPQQLPVLHQVCGIGVARGIEEICSVKIRIKWPNDILVGDRKVGGILIESIVESSHVIAVIAGIGVNVNIGKEGLPERPVFPATSLMIELGNMVDLQLLSKSIAKNIMSVYDQFLLVGVVELIEEWNTRSILSGKNVKFSVDGVTVKGKVEGISGRGGLLLRDSATDLVKEYLNGEVTGY